ncbi:MAG: COG3236 protein [uncultured marine phage]|uniref:COG3236 protein n=1 Tax=uncultured marine phage TaxID=707152 RepID=A0A8D9FSL2_9VIRU|nr:MAG: COG3236 protein [uncultured marine phage]
MIEQFKGEYRWMSNFYECEVEYGGITYPSVENFYVAMKTTDLDQRKYISTLTAGQSKRFGRELEMEGKLRENWTDLKVSIMKYGLEEKFSKEPFKTMLLETEDEEIQEGNTWGDTFWGVDLETKEGKNVLGKMIMQIRKELK